MRSYTFTRMLSSLIAFSLLSTTLVFISSCASGPSFSKIQSIPEGKSVAYFYRPARFYGSGSSPSIFDNGKEILNGLPNGGYWAYFVEPGKHTFSTGAAILQGSYVTVDSKETSEEYYIRMDVMAGAFVSDAKLFRVYPEQGQQEIAECKMIE